MNNLILFGHKNCGKSYLGEYFAKRLRYTFIDIDRIIEQLHFKEYGNTLSCSEIYRILGKEEFRRLEHKAVLSIRQVTHSLIALGGGTPFNPHSLDILKKMGALIYLKVDKETLKKRTLSQSLPSFFEDENSFEKIYQERTPFYESIATNIIEIKYGQ